MCNTYNTIYISHALYVYPKIINNSKINSRILKRKFCYETVQAVIVFKWKTIKFTDDKTKISRDLR
jgi:hypothetical protein